MSSLKQEGMNFSNRQLILAFKSWLQAQEFYTGEDGDKTLSHWDGYLLTAGMFALNMTYVTYKALKKSKTSTYTSIPDFSSAKDAEKAEPKLAKLRNEFDFAGFRTKWSTPTLMLGLLADSLSVSEIEKILSRIPKQVSPLKKYGARGDEKIFGLGGQLFTYILLIYTDSEVCKQHFLQLSPVAANTSKPWGTTVSAWFIDINKRTLETSPPQRVINFLGQDKNGKRDDPRKTFKKCKLDKVIAFLTDENR